MSEGRHAEDIQGSDIITVGTVLTGRAVEEAAGLDDAFASGIENFRAFGTTARTVAGGATSRDGDNLDAGKACLMFEESLQETVDPVIQPAVEAPEDTLTMGQRRTRSMFFTTAMRGKIAKVFESNRPTPELCALLDERLDGQVGLLETTAVEFGVQTREFGLATAQDRGMGGSIMEPFLDGANMLVETFDIGVELGGVWRE
jgi:hypothetical protein